MKLNDFNTYRLQVIQYSKEVADIIDDSKYQDIFKHDLGNTKDKESLFYDFQKLSNMLNNFNQDKIKVVLLGQYNTGKSSLVAALTEAQFKGQENEAGKTIDVYEIPDSKQQVKIGAQVLTSDTHSYFWKEVELIDTPGVGTEYEDHNTITYSKINEAHIILFVVSIELFDEYSENLFKNYALDRADRVILIVNKFGDSINPKENLLQGILPVINPLKEKDIPILFTDAKYFLQSQKEEDTEDKEYYINKSNISNLSTKIVEVIKYNGQERLFLLTPIDNLIRVIEEFKPYLNSEETNKLGAIQKLKGQRQDLLKLQEKIIESRNHLKQEIDNVLTDLRMKMKSSANELVTFILQAKDTKSIGDKQEEVSKQFDEHTEQASTVVSEKVKEELEKLRKLINAFFEKPTVRVHFTGFNQQNPINQNVSKIIENLKLVPDLLKPIGDFALGVDKKMVYDFVKFFGGKFKPWGAVKWAKFLQGLGPIIVVVAQTVDIIQKFGEKHAEELKHKAYEDKREELEKETNEMIENTIQAFWQGSEIGENDNKQKTKSLEEAIFIEVYQKQIDQLTERATALMQQINDMESTIRRITEIQNEVIEIKMFV